MRPALLTLLVLGAVNGLAQPVPPKPEPAIAFVPEAIVWREGASTMPPGTKMAVLEGNPAMDGMFTLRLRVPAGSTIPPHWHPRQERVTILSGAVNLGFGSVAGVGTVTRYAAGSFYVNPPRVMHYLSFPEATEMQMTGVGPWEMQTSDISTKPGGASTATVTIRSISPSAGSVLTAASTVKVVVDYEIRNFKPSTFFLMIMYESTTPGRTVGIGRTIVTSGDRPAAPPTPDFLRTPTGSITLTQDLSNAFPRLDFKHPPRIRVFLQEQLTESSANVAGMSDWIEYR